MKRRHRRHATAFFTDTTRKQEQALLSTHSARSQHHQQHLLRDVQFDKKKKRPSEADVARARVKLAPMSDKKQAANSFKNK